MKGRVIDIKAIIITLIMFFSGSVVSAADNPMGALGGFLKSIQGKTLQEKSQKNVQTDVSASGQQGVLNPFSSNRAVESHAYESALQDTDYTCETIVDPFELEKNFSKIISDTAKDKKVLFGMFLKPDAGKLLEAGKKNAKRMNWMPLNFETRYGGELHKQEVVSDDKFIPRNTKGRYRDMYKEADNLLQQVLTAIDEEYPYEFQIYLLDSTQIQGHAAPGGYLYITTGVLENDYADFVLAHEIAHVLKRHHTRELQARIIDTVETVDDLKKLADIDKLSEDKLSEIVRQHSATSLNFSRQQELQSDACSVQIAGIQSKGDLRKRVASYARELGQGDESGKAGMFSVHPGYADRFQRMDTVAGLVSHRRNTAVVDDRLTTSLH